MQTIRLTPLGHAAPVALVALSPRERQIVQSVMQGLTNKAIAWRLAIAEATVKTTLGRIYRALGLANRMELMRWALEHAEVLHTPSAAVDPRPHPEMCECESVVCTALRIAQHGPAYAWPKAA